MMVEKPWDSLSLFDSDGMDFWDRTTFDSCASVPIPPVKTEPGTSPTTQLIPKCVQPDGEEEIWYLSDGEANDIGETIAAAAAPLMTSFAVVSTDSDNDSGSFTSHASSSQSPLRASSPSASSVTSSVVTASDGECPTKRRRQDFAATFCQLYEAQPSQPSSQSQSQPQPPVSPRLHKRERVAVNEFDAYNRRYHDEDEEHDNDNGEEDESLDEYASELLSALQPNPYAAVRRMRRRLMRIPVLPKSDIRRYYLSMFTNAINSHDPSFLKQFLTTYCQPTVTLQRIGNCKFHHSSVQQPPMTPYHSMDSYRKLLTTTTNKSEFMKKQFHLKRVQEIFAFWAVKYDLHPDHMCRFREMRVITTRASESVRLEGHFTVTKTDIYEITPPLMHSLFTSKIQEHMGDGLGGAGDAEEGPRWLSCSCGRPHGSNRSAEDLDAMSEVLEAGHQCKVTSLPLSREPMQCVLEGDFVLIIGPDKRIEQIQLLPHQVQFKPLSAL